MPKININGHVREMTAEEVAEMERLMAETPPPELSDKERIAELEEALALLLSGVTQ